MDASRTGPLLVGLAIAGVGLLALILLRKLPAKSPQAAEALLRGRPFLHYTAVFLLLVGLVLVLARLV